MWDQYACFKFLAKKKNMHALSFYFFFQSALGSVWYMYLKTKNCCFKTQTKHPLTHLNFNGEVTILILILKVILHLILKYYKLLSL